MEASAFTRSLDMLTAVRGTFAFHDDHVRTSPRAVPNVSGSRRLCGAGGAVMPMSRDHDADMNVEDDPSGRIERAMGLLRRILQYQVSIAALIEVALWLAIHTFLSGSCGRSFTLSRLSGFRRD